jgi:hypothetical protein
MQHDKDYVWHSRLKDFSQTLIHTVQHSVLGEAFLRDSLFEMEKSSDDAGTNALSTTRVKMIQAMEVWLPRDPETRHYPPASLS